MSEPDVRLERAMKQFGEVKAVTTLSLSFDRGGFVALLGLGMRRTPPRCG